ncbi:MAG TPA: hypothetical protein VFI47_09465, partial [Acidimicrobiales bacterium]|nr:hypothetical protein [Acidimicrobiales bacterium]
MAMRAITMVPRVVGPERGLVSDAQPSGPEQRSVMAEGSWMAWTVAGIAGIWVAVLLISVFSPDLI